MFIFDSHRLREIEAISIQDREIIERNNQQLSDYEAEINLLRRRIESLEADRERDKKEIARLTEALNRARIVSIPFPVYLEVIATSSMSRFQLYN